MPRDAVDLDATSPTPAEPQHRIAQLQHRIAELETHNRALALRVRLEERLNSDEASGLTSTVQVAHEMLRHPVALIDMSGRTVTQAPATTRPPDLMRVLSTLGPRSLDSRSASVVPAGSSTGLTHRLLLVPVISGGGQYGWLLAEERGSPFAPVDQVIIERAAQRLGAEFRVQSRIARVAGDARAVLARQLARGTGAPQDLRSSGEYLGVDVEARRVLVFVLQRSPDLGPDEDWLGPNEPGFGRALAAATGGDVLETRGREGHLYLVEVDADEPGAAAVARVLRSVRELLPVHLPDTAVAGVSGACEPDLFRRSYREARELAHCIGRLATDRGLRALSVDDVGPARLFLANSDSHALRAHVDDVMGPLLCADAAMTELLRTLQCWFDVGRSVRGSAAMLNVHENTVRLRLARIGGLTGLDCAVPNDQLSLQTALLVLRLQGHPALPPFGATADLVEVSKALDSPITDRITA